MSRLTGGGEMMKLAITAGAVLVAVAIVIGTLQAQDEFTNSEDPGMATSTPVATATPRPVATTTVALTDSTIVFQVRGGDDPCRYLYMHNRTGTFAGAEIPLVFIAGTHDEVGLAETNEMHLYGDTGPHDFIILNKDGVQIIEVHVGRGQTVEATAIFSDVGLYRLYDAAYSSRHHIAEIFARPIGQAGYVPVTGWCDNRPIVY